MIMIMIPTFIIHPPPDQRPCSFPARWRSGGRREQRGTTSDPPSSLPSPFLLSLPPSQGDRDGGRSSGCDRGHTVHRFLIRNPPPFSPFPLLPLPCPPRRLAGRVEGGGRAFLLTAPWGCDGPPCASIRTHAPRSIAEGVTAKSAAPRTIERIISPTAKLLAESSLTRFGFIAKRSRRAGEEQELKRSRKRRRLFLGYQRRTEGERETIHTTIKRAKLRTEDGEENNLVHAYDKERDSKLGAFCLLPHSLLPPRVAPPLSPPRIFCLLVF